MCIRDRRYDEDYKAAVLHQVVHEKLGGSLVSWAKGQGMIKSKTCESWSHRFISEYQAASWESFSGIQHLSIT
eukprot:3785335-Prorocentrum_lima.AAC.1